MLSEIMMLGSKGILTPMIHGLLRISCSRNPKTPQIRSFFYEKWLLFGVLAGQLDKNPPASKLAKEFYVYLTLVLCKI